MPDENRFQVVNLMLRMFAKASICGIFILTVVVSSSAKSACYDLSRSEPIFLSGFLTGRIFPGPPEYEDVQKGDTPKQTYILALPGPICVKGDENADPNLKFNEVHLVSTDDTSKAMRSLINSTVEVTVIESMAAITGHHHRPLVAWVSAITPYSDPTAEYGTAATTVRAFYYALSLGNGVEATTLLVPRKQNRGAFSAERMTAFYGGLSDPLQLIDLRQQGPNEYLVQYKFRSGSRACNGRAVVKTVSIGDQFYIESIKALDDC